MFDDLEIKKEAVWGVSNCTASATPQQFWEIVNKGIIKALCESLKIKDPRILAVALEGLSNILKCG
jgi:importin subunit alpha-1